MPDAQIKAKSIFFGKKEVRQNPRGQGHGSERQAKVNIKQGDKGGEINTEGDEEKIPQTDDSHPEKLACTGGSDSYSSKFEYSLP